jgi:hypothetical protein
VHGAGLVGGAGRALATARARTGAREKAQGHREVQWPAGTLEVTLGNFSDSSIFFPIAPVDFQSIGGGEGRGAGSELFFGIFFFFVREFGGRGGEGGTPKPEARVARFLVGMFRN